MHWFPAALFGIFAFTQPLALAPRVDVASGAVYLYQLLLGARSEETR